MSLSPQNLPFSAATCDSRAVGVETPRGDASPVLGWWDAMHDEGALVAWGLWAGGAVVMVTPVDACPKCGAPIYVPTVWHGVTGPPIQRSCGCFPQPPVVYSSNTGTR